MKKLLLLITCITSSACAMEQPAKRHQAKSKSDIISELSAIKEQIAAAEAIERASVGDPEMFQQAKDLLEKLTRIGDSLIQKLTPTVKPTHTRPYQRSAAAADDSEIVFISNSEATPYITQSLTQPAPAGIASKNECPFTQAIQHLAEKPNQSIDEIQEAEFLIEQQRDKRIREKSHNRYLKNRDKVIRRVQASRLAKKRAAEPHIIKR